MYNHDLIQDFLRPGNLVIIAGPPKVGKTAIASAMALAVAKGKPFAGTEATHGAVLWLALEESPNERAEIMRRLKGRARTPFYTCYRRIKPDTDDGMAKLWHMYTILQPALIVVDPLFAAQSTRSNSQTLKNLRGLAEQTGTAVLVLHHLRAHNPRLEAVELVKFATAVWSLDYSPDGRNRLVTLRSEAKKLGPDPQPITIRLRSKSPLHYAPLPEANIFSGTAEVLHLLQDHGALSSRQIASLAGIALGSVRNILTDLRRRGKVRIALKSARTPYYEFSSHHAH
jgi:hypothetical protein